MKRVRVAFFGRSILVGLVVALLGTAAVRPALAAPSWSRIMKTFTVGWDPTSDNVCVRGDLTCVDAVVREMNDRFDPLVSKCNHDAAFSLLYLRTTEEYRRTVAGNPSFFDNTPLINHEDALFALYYFRAFDDWHQGRASQVPPAWRTAFAAADNKEVTGGGNILLGINAHINRDLPFVVEAIGLTKRDKGKADHNKVNEILRRVQKPAIAEAARRLDPTIDDAQVNGTDLDEEAFIKLVEGWREQAWDNGVALSNAPTKEARAAIAASIESSAAAEAASIKQSSAYLPGTSSASRDEYCAQHWNDR